MTGTLAVGVLLSGCATQENEGGRKTEAQVRSKYQQQAAALREKLKELASKLPQRINPKTVPPFAMPDPQMSLRQLEENTYFLAEPQLLDPQSELKFDLFRNSEDRLVGFLQWMAATPDRPATSIHALAGFDSSDAERLLATKYIVVWRLVKHVLPEAVDPGNIDAGYRPGQATVDVFVVKLATLEILAMTQISASTSGRVSFNVKKDNYVGAFDVPKMVEAADHSVEESARSQMVEWLIDKLGALDFTAHP